MSPSTARQSFRETVAHVAEKARARLPQAVNGRIESAARLVLLHDVAVQEDGSILVGSASDPLKQYRLEGHSCECQDFTRGQAPEGWCQHRIAAGIAKRVQEVLTAQAPPVETEPAPTPAPVGPLPEAPVSITLKAHVHGFETLVTLRGTDFASVQAQVEHAAAWLKTQAPQPAPAPPAQLSPQQHNALAQHQPVVGVCALHQVAMTLNQKEGRSWWSHRLPEGGWCKGK